MIYQTHAFGRAEMPTKTLLALTISLALFLYGCGADPQIYRFGKEVPQEEREAVTSGVEAMRAWLLETAGVRLRRFSVYVDGDINTLIGRYTYYVDTEDPLAAAQWFMNGGAVASGSTIYIYAGSEWRSPVSREKAFVAAHETYHVAQYGYLYDDLILGGVDERAYPPAWLVEGSADYAAARALDAAGLYPYKEFRQRALTFATRQRASLADLTVGDVHVAGEAEAYILGFLAVEALVARAGESAVSDFWDYLGEHSGWTEAFAAAFSVELDTFVSDFERLRQSEFPPLAGGLAGALMRPDGGPVPGAGISVCGDAGECRFTFTADDGTFRIALEPGVYRVFYRVATRGGVEQGEFAAPRPDGFQVADVVISGVRATVRDDF